MIKDYNYYLEKVKDNGWNLRHVPKEMIDYNLCEIAVTQNGCALEFVPEEFKDYKFEWPIVVNLYYLSFISTFYPDTFYLYTYHHSIYHSTKDVYRSTNLNFILHFPT